MIASVPVWFDALHVGEVTVSEDGALAFSYSEKWLATEGAFPLSLTLPLDEARYPSEVISPWLANLLPEEEQLHVLTRSLGLDRADTLAVLKEIGGDTAGALSFGAPSQRAAWTYTPLTDFYQIKDPELALERHFEDLQHRPFLVGEEGVRLSLAGGQKKSALAVLDANGASVLRLPGDGDVLAIPRNGAPSTVILKPDNPILPGIVENETYCLRLAEAIGLASAKVTLLTAGKRKAICVLLSPVNATAASLHMVPSRCGMKPAGPGRVPVPRRLRNPRRDRPGAGRAWTIRPGSAPAARPSGAAGRRRRRSASLCACGPSR